MSFSEDISYSLTFEQNKSICSSLSKYEQIQSLTATMASENSLKRTALCTSCKMAGSLTVEAALVLPVFLFLCIGVSFLIQIFAIHSEVQGDLFLAARDISQYPAILHVGENISKNEGIGALLGASFGEEKVSEYTKGNLEQYSCLAGGSKGIHYWYSAIKDDEIDLVASYEVRLPYTLGLDIVFPVIQRCRMHLWIGMSGTDLVDADEEMVYITQTGSVYHKSRDCTHIKLSIRQIAASELTAARNDGGAKYKPCEKCAKLGVVSNRLYITQDGTSYHNTLNCSGLKRTVSQIPKSQAGSRKPCSKCAQ